MARKHAAQQNGKTKAAAPMAEYVLALARILETPDPAVQIERLQSLRNLAEAPVLTLVLQVDTRDQSDRVTITSAGAPIPAHLANMMLAQATKQIATQQIAAQQQAEADKQAQQPPAPAVKKP